MSRNGSGTYVPPSGTWNPAIDGVTATGADWNALLSDLSAALTQSVSKDGQTTMTGNLPMGGFVLTGLGAGAATGQSLRWQQLFSQGIQIDLASATTTDIGAENTNFLNITGTTTITSFGTNYNGPRFLRFDGALTLTHNATTLILPGGANITTAAGDTCIAVPNSGTSGTADGWLVMAYVRANGGITLTGSSTQTSGSFTQTGTGSIQSGTGGILASNSDIYANVGNLMANRANATGATTDGALVLRIDGGNSGFIGTPASGAIAFYNASGTERMRMSATAGALQLNLTSTPIAKLEMNNSSLDAIHCADFKTDGTSVFRVENDGDVKNTNNSYGAISDARLKENIEDATAKLDKLLRVRVRTFNLIGSDLKQIGVVAQELREVFPSLVDEDADGTLSVKYSVLVPILVKAVQELAARVAALESA